MLKFRTTLNLLAAVCLLGALLFLVNYHSGLKMNRDTETRLLFDFANSEVTELIIMRDDVKIECVKKGKDWFIKQPVRARADAAVVERIISKLEMLKWDDRISAEQRKLRGLSLNDYGLKSPKIRVAVGSDNRRMTVLLGDETPLGNGIYAGLSHSDDIFTVSPELTAVLPDSIDSLRDSFVLHGTPDETIRLEIARSGAGFVQLVKQADQWMIQQPISARADTTEIRFILDAVYSLKVEKFLWDMNSETNSDSGNISALEIASSAKEESYGLAGDAVQMRITSWVKGDSLGQELLLGKVDSEHPGYIFAKRRGNNAIYTVKDSIVKVCGAELSTLRDRTIFTIAKPDVGYVELKAGEDALVLEHSNDPGIGWRVLEPVQWDAERKSVEDLIDQILSLSAAGYISHPVPDSLGFEHPRYAISLFAESPENKTDTEDTSAAIEAGGELLVGNLMDDNNSFAKMAGRDEVFTIKTSSLNKLVNKKGISPLGYRERTMLTLKPEHIQRINVVTLAGEYGVEFDAAKKGWICCGVPSMQADVDAIVKVADLISNIRAEVITEFNPKDLAQYGLAAPLATLTVGLQGEDNIQKSILLGCSPDEKASYAMVRGQDLVFPVSKSFVDALTAPLCISVPQETNTVEAVEGAN